MQYESAVSEPVDDLRSHAFRRFSPASHIEVGPGRFAEGVAVVNRPKQSRGLKHGQWRGWQE